MTKVAIFPGQGSQAVGMGKALADHSAAARAVFAEVDDALGAKLSKVIFEGPIEALTLTENAQPALMATSLAAVRALEERLGGPLAEHLDYVAGHSLGEYSALAAVGALQVGDAARLLRLRGLAMQEAVPLGEGAMAAVLGLDPATAEEVARLAAAEGGVCDLANDNADGQAVLSGSSHAIDRAILIAKQKGAKRVVPLQVSAPFHCALMKPAAEKLHAALAATRFERPARPVIANVTAEPVDDAALLVDLLTRQVTSRVRWRETMATMGRLGATTIAELGAGKVLSGLVKRGVPGAVAVNLQEPGDLDAVAQVLAH